MIYIKDVTNVEHYINQDHIIRITFNETIQLWIITLTSGGVISVNDKEAQLLAGVS